MVEKDKRLADNIARMLCVLPSNKQEYLAGVVDGMAAMAAEFDIEQTRSVERRDSA